MESKQKTMTPLRTLASIPENIITDEILNRLPIKEAVRTCVLSRTWRRRWQSIPDLSLISVEPHVVSQIAALHSGNVRTFKYASSGNVDGEHSTINQSLAALSTRGGAYSLNTLELWDFDCRLNALARAFPNLIFLRLGGGSHYLSRDCARFECLDTLWLVDITLSGKLSMVFSLCPLLSTAFVMNIVLKERQLLDIVAPNLRYIDLSEVDNLIEYSVESAEVLGEVVLNVDVENDGAGVAGRGCRVTKVLGGMRNVEKLELYHNTVEYFLGGDVPKRLWISFDNLRYLSIGAHLGHVSHVLLLLCLLRSCPNLEQLECKNREYNGENIGLGQDFWEAQDHIGVFDKLKTVIMDTQGVKVELDFIQYILAKAQSLKEVMVGLGGSILDKGLILSQLSKFPVISKQAQILIKKV